jgi:DNA-binding CsgD family transcriptional regulator
MGKKGDTRPVRSRRANHGSRAVPGKVPRGSFHMVRGDGFTGLGRIILDRLDRGVVLLDAGGRVLDANASAVQVLEAGDGLAVRGGRLAFTDGDLDARLAGLIAPRRGPGLPEPGAEAAGPTTTVAAQVRRNGGASYRVVVSVVPEGSDDRAVAFVAYIYAPNERREISEAVLRELYGLTPAQAQVVRSLFAGRSVERTAARLGLSPNTVRTHLKHVFTKCEVQSQGELLHLLAMGPHDL